MNSSTPQLDGLHPFSSSASTRPDRALHTADPAGTVDFLHWGPFDSASHEPTTSRDNDRAPSCEWVVVPTRDSCPTLDGLLGDIFVMEVL